MMHWYMCHYPARPEYARMTKSGPDDLVSNYGSFIWANSFKHAKVLARRRNIGEVVDGTWGTKKSKPYPLTSDLLASRRISKALALDIVHGTAFLSYLLMQSHSAPACDILGDEGLLHQVIHSLLFGSPRRKDMIGTLRYFEARVPGYTKEKS